MAAKWHALVGEWESEMRKLPKRADDNQVFGVCQRVAKYKRHAIKRVGIA